MRARLVVLGLGAALAGCVETAGRPNYVPAPGQPDMRPNYIPADPTLDTRPGYIPAAPRGNLPADRR